MKKTLLAITLIMLATSLLPAGCGNEAETTAEEGTDTTTVESAASDDSAASTPVPADFDFQATGKEYVAAAAAGDCEAAADLHGWTEASESSNRQTVIVNCQKLNVELTGMGEPTATQVREEAQSDADVSVWVTREYADGSQWEMMMVFRDKTGKGWVVSTFAYGMKDQAE